MVSINDCPADIIQYIGFLTNSINDYYHLAITSKHNYKILQNERRIAFFDHFTEHGHSSKKNIYGYYDEYWKFNGKFHREHDLPAQIEPKSNYDGSRSKGLCIKVWYRHGKMHRENDLPAVVHSDLNGERHRDNGLPACIYNTDGEFRPGEWWSHGEYLLHARYGKLWSGIHVVHNSVENITYVGHNIITDKLWTTQPNFIIPRDKIIRQNH